MTLILDPAEIALPGRTELDLMSEELMVRAEGIDWGDAALELHRAKGKYGEQVIDYDYPNRQITAPIRIRGTQTTTFAEALADLQAKVARLTEEGGHLKRVRRNGEPLYADVVAATLNLPDSWLQEHREIEPEAQLILECLPDFYGEEIVLTSHMGANGIVNWTETNIRGNYPARTRLTITDESSVNHMGVAVGARARHYSPAATAALTYGAADLEPLDLASTSGGTVTHPNLGTSWTPVLGLRMGNGSYWTHVGEYRVLVAVSTQSENPPRVRLATASGDLASFDSGEPVRVPGDEATYLLDLGVVRLPYPTIGNPRWYGVLQAQGDNGGEDLTVERVRLLPVSESSTRLSASLTTDVPPSGYLARDPLFPSASGALNGAPLPDGSGTWTTSGGAGDFGRQANIGVNRQTTNDTNSRVATPPGGWQTALGMQTTIRFEYLPREGTGTQIQAGMYYGSSLGGRMIAVHADANFPGGDVIQRLLFFNRTIENMNWLPNVSYTITAIIFNGQWAAGWVSTDGTATGPPDIISPIPTYSSGYGLYDFCTFNLPVPRWYSHFSTWSPLPSAVLAAGRSLEISSAGALREAADGSAWGSIVPYGDNLRLPVSGRENRPVEVLVLASRGDFDLMPDSGLDTVSARLAYRPCWIHVPEDT